MDTVKIAGVQMDIALANKEANFSEMAKGFVKAAEAGAQIIAFPECALTGYGFSTREEAISVAEPKNGPTAERFAELCRQHSAIAIYGYLESDGERLFNALAMVGPDGLIAGYRKIHMPFIGVDRFANPGDQPFKVITLTKQHLPELTAEVAIGMIICYDCSFPESVRVLSLLNADLIVLPTNWPTGARGTADYIVAARSIENHIYFMAVDRIGSESGFQFIGKSRICDPIGTNLAFADHQDAEIVIADIVPEKARNKSTINVPGEYELHRIADRRPEFYQSLVSLGSESETKQ